MPIERRAYPRYRPQGLKGATIIMEQPLRESLRMDGEVLDLSYTGIKILLNAPFPEIPDGKIVIELQLPETGIPITIKGLIKYISSSELGLDCAEDTAGDLMDQLLFECVKIPGRH